MLVNVLHSVTTQVETQAQIAGAKHAMEIGNGSEILGCKSTVKRIKPLDTMILHFQVCPHKTYIGSQILKERTGKRLAQHRNTQMRILLCQRIDHRHDHSHVAHGRKTNYQDMFSFQLADYLGVNYFF